ncbi:hypothetical protein GGF31_006211 [Allomyces arbusculus]|nr:hypothetical protein GGF31_006211 [Allomyces arbusculus]
MAGVAMRFDNLTELELPILTIPNKWIATGLQFLAGRLTSLQLCVPQAEWDEAALMLMLPNLCRLNVQLHRLTVTPSVPGSVLELVPVGTLPRAPLLQVLALHSPAGVTSDVIVKVLHEISGTLRELTLVSVLRPSDKIDAPLPALTWPALRHLEVSAAVMRIMIAGHAAAHSWIMPNLQTLHVQSIVSETKQDSDLRLPVFPVFPCLKSVTIRNLTVPKVHLAHLATTSTCLVHLALHGCKFDEDQGHSSPAEFSELTKLVVNNHHVDVLIKIIAAPQLATLVLCVITDDPVRKIPWPTITSLTFATCEEEIAVSSIALDMLPHLSQLKLPPVAIEWIDGSLPVLRNVTDLTASVDMLAKLDPPNVVRVATPRHFNIESVSVIPKHARQIHVHCISLDLLASLSVRDDIETVVVEMIGGQWGDRTDTLVLWYRQGHPVWRVFCTADVWKETPMAKRLVIHVERIDDERVAVDEMAKGIAVIAGVSTMLETAGQVDADEVEGTVDPALPPLPASSFPLDVVLAESMSPHFKDPLGAMLTALLPQGIIGAVWDWCDYS